MSNREKDALGIDELAYDANGLIPAVVQQHDTGEVLMVAYMNRESLAETIETGKTWFWSRSRQKYWMKGESSGHVQDVVEIRYDCDADCLLVLVDQRGSACHTMERSCFYRTLFLGVGPEADEDEGVRRTLIAEADVGSADAGDPDAGVPLEEA
jgi:phosphoribosyl-AMP cyclohydrolase